jgi:hypothetical protein
MKSYKSNSSKKTLTDLRQMKDLDHNSMYQKESESEICFSSEKKEHYSQDQFLSEKNFKPNQFKDYQLELQRQSYNSSSSSPHFKKNLDINDLKDFLINDKSDQDQNSQRNFKKKEKNSHQSEKSPIKKKKKSESNQITNRQNNVKVFLRIRPPFSEYTFINKIAKNKLSLEITKDFELKAFAFDKVIGPKEKQLKAFGVTCTNILKSILEGYNGCLIAYGQTGSGKTYTILGDQEKNVKGLLQLSLAYLLSSQKKIWLEMSAVQIYMENIYDIFDIENNANEIGKFNKNNVRSSMKFTNHTHTQNLFSHLRKVKFSYTSKNGMKLNDILTYKIDSIEDVEEIINLVNINRRTEKTKMNDKSSRSHAVFMVKVHNPEFTGYSTFYLVDLAGSERVKKSQVRDKVTMDETISINTSLMALSKCISSLMKEENLRNKKDKKKSDRSHSPNISHMTSSTKTKKLNMTSEYLDRTTTTSRTEKNKHVPFRESKLTMLLQNCLLGKSMLGLIIAISPDDHDVDESFSTLRFGQCAAKMEIKPIKNEDIERQKQIEKIIEKKNQSQSPQKQIKKKGIEGDKEALQDEIDQLDREINLNIQRNLSKNIKNLDDTNNTNFSADDVPEEEPYKSSTSSKRRELMKQLIVESLEKIGDRKKKVSPSRNVNSSLNQFERNSENEDFAQYERDIRDMRSKGESLDILTNKYEEDKEYREGNNSNFTFRYDSGQNTHNSGLQNSLYQNITNNVMGDSKLSKKNSAKVVDSEIIDSNILNSQINESMNFIQSNVSQLISILNENPSNSISKPKIISELMK